MAWEKVIDIVGPPGTFDSITVSTIAAGATPSATVGGTPANRTAHFNLNRGLPGTNAVANDEAFATYMSATDTLTRASMNSAIDGKFNEGSVADMVASQTEVRTRVNEIVGGFSGSISARDFGVDPTGATSSINALQAAVDAVPEGGTLHVPNGRYLFPAGWALTATKSFHIDWHNSTIINAGLNSTALQIAGPAPTPLNVSSVSRVVIPATDADWTANPVPGVSVTISSGSTSDWRRGDYVKLVADDPIPGARYETGTSRARMGQHFQVHSISGPTVILSGYLREAENYTTNIRIGRLASHQVAISNLRITAPDSIFDTPGLRSGVRFDSLVNPVVTNLVVERSAGTCIAFRGCYGYTASNLDLRLAKNTNGSVYGYGVADNSCENGLVYGLRGGKLRHAFTDDTPRVLANADMISYGRTFNAKIVDSTSTSSSSTSWDTHLCSEGVWFINCTSVASAGGFNLRGRRHRVVNGVVRNFIGVALEISDEGSSGGESWGHQISSLSIRDGDGVGISIRNNPAEHPTSANVRELRPNVLSNVRIESHTGRAISVSNSTTQFRNLYLDCLAFPSSGALVQISGSEVNGRDLDIVTTSTNVSTKTLINPIDSSFTAVGYSIKTAQAPSLFVFTTGASLVELRGGLVSHEMRSIVAEGSVMSWAVAATASSGAGNRPSAFTLTDETFNDRGRVLSVLADVEAQGWVLNLNFGARRIMAATPAGRTPGQVLMFRNIGTGNGVLLNGGNVSIGANRDIVPGEVYRLFWTGSVWIVI